MGRPTLPPTPDPDLENFQGLDKPPPLPAILPLPVARLGRPRVAPGTVVPQLEPLLADDPYTGTETVEVEVQRMVIKGMVYEPIRVSMTGEVLPPEVQPSEAQPVTAQPVTVVAATDMTATATPTTITRKPVQSTATMTAASKDETTQTQTQTETQAQPHTTQPQLLAAPTPPEIDVSSLLGPDLTPTATNMTATTVTTATTTTTTATTTGTRSSLVSNDTGSTAAPATPATENDSPETESDEDENYDTDDEDVALPGFLEGVEGDNNDEGYDLKWANVEPPAALRNVDNNDGPEMPEIPEILREIVVSSIESVQAQLVVEVAAQAERDAAAAQARAEAEAAAKEAAQAAAEARRQQQILMMEQQEKQVAVDKGKEKDTATRHIPEADPIPVSARVKPSRRHFASRMLRHVHVLGGGSQNGESSSAGAAAAEAAAAAKAAKAAKHAAQRAYEEAMLRRFEGPSVTTAKAGPSKSSPSIAGPSNQATLQRAYEEAMLRSLEGGASSSSSTAPAASSSSSPAVTMTMGTAPIPNQRRAAMLLAMVRKDMEKKKEPVPPATIECISCFEDIPVKEAVKTVCHSYCLDCFSQLVTTALDNEAQFPPKCCLNEVPAKTVAKYVPRELGKRYQLKVDEFATPLADRVYCPTPDCGVWVPPAHVASVARIARCRNGHETCTACRQAAHGRGSANREACPEASAQDRRHQELADELAREEGWRHCIRCAVLIEHREACQHMTCRCGAEFCYVCGLVWRTCHCDMEDLARLKREAETRRTQRTAREARERERVRQQEEAANAELAELRDALAQIAAFEQRERQQLRRVQQAQRARLQRLKEQREVTLRAEVAAKYASLRDLLEALNTRQADRAGVLRKEERTALKAEVEEKHTAAVARQQETRAEAAAAAADAIRDAERHWQRDYRDRLALEVQLENEYEHALTNGLPKATVIGAEAALKAYQRTNDARLDAYFAWRDRALAQARWTAEEARGVREEEADAEMYKTRRQGRRARQDLSQKHAGERMWCRAVTAVRLRLLAEMQVVEQDLGLAGSTSEADTNLLLLLDLEASGALGEDGGGDNDNAPVDDTEMSHLYAMMLADAAGDVDEADLAALGGGGAVNDDEDAWVDDDHESFYSVYGGGGGGAGDDGNRNSGSSNGRGGARFRAEYNWPLSVGQ
ncbi:hypothetical protein SBRCBS47491_000925 [Sporothrix bragantina]|uniref:RBR-type E3 ubiquitin transferase n=1 Tax=Sporothrix bragantina TaxID=671064 RepID=A0ABP0AUF6_9PEZI